MISFKFRKYRPTDFDDVKALYESVGWHVYTQDASFLKSCFTESKDIYLAIYHAEVIGLIRTVGDGLSILYIQDLLIKPEYQRKGIGRYMLNFIHENYRDAKKIILLTDKDDVSNKFYQELDMKKAEDIGTQLYGYFNVL